jgi:hypothetical protein
VKAFAPTRVTAELLAEAPTGERAEDLREAFERQEIYGDEAPEPADAPPARRYDEILDRRRLADLIDELCMAAGEDDAAKTLVVANAIADLLMHTNEGTFDILAPQWRAAAPRAREYTTDIPYLISIAKQNTAQLSAWERKFVHDCDVQAWTQGLTDKQIAVLVRLVRRIEAASEWGTWREREF